MAGSTVNIIALPEVFGPEDADTDVAALVQDGNPQQGGFIPTGGGDDLEGYGVDLASLLLFSFTGIYIPPGVLRVLLDEVIKFAEWIAGFFEGVPHKAKTLGVGQQLVHRTDPIAQWIGLNLINAAAQDRVLSEGNWPHNFGGRLIAMGGALIEFANREPPGAWWHVRDTPASAIARFNDEARQFRLGPVPPPKGAPYHQPIIIDGFFAQRVVDPAAYKAQFGFDQPTPDQLQQFLNDKRGVFWHDQRVAMDRLYLMRNAFRQLFVDAFKEWLKSNPQPEPGQPPPPPSGVCTDPCELQVIEQLYSIALQINAGNTATMAYMQSLQALLTALRSLSPNSFASVLQKLVDCVCPNLDAIAKYLAGGDGTPLHSIMDSLKKLAEGGGAGDGDLKRIADSFAEADAMRPNVRAVIRQLVGQGVIDPQLMQVYGL